MLYLLAGPIVALIGIIAIFFVLRRKSVEKHSMYSARRSQIEHKVRAARQRTLAGHGHAEKAAEAAPAPASPFDAPQTQPTAYFEPTARQAPPTPPPAAAPPVPAWETPAAPKAMPWETGPSEPPPAAAPPSFDYPAAPPEPFPPAPEPARRAEPAEPAWNPAPEPAAPPPPVEQPVAAATPSAAGWSIVTTAKESPMPESGDRRRARGGGSSWELASGEAPGLEGADETEAKRPSATLVAVAQYAVLVVGLVMVLIGVLVMVANSHVS